MCFLTAYFAHLCFKKGKIKSKFVMNSIDFLPYLLLIIITGFRYNVGTDYQGYVTNFNLFETSNIGRFEITFQIITGIAHFFNLNQQFLFLTYAAITYTFIYLSVKYFDKLGEYRHFIIMLVLLYILFNSFNTIRQMAAVAIFFYSLRFIIEKKIFKYFIFIFIASLFHQSALICFIFYPLLVIKSNKLFIVLLISPVFLLTNIGNYLIEIYVWISGSNWYESYLSSYNKRIEFSGGKLVFIQYLIAVFYNLTMHKVDYSQREKVIIKLFTLYQIMLCIALSSEAAMRILYYPMVSFVLAIPLLRKYFMDKKGKLFANYLIALYILILWTNTLISNRELFNENGLLRYTFKFFVG